MSLKARTEIALRDFQKGILVAPGDVGVGISQMVPVVVAALRKRDGILAIEQPELHIHPAIQVGIGDLFIRAVHADPDGCSCRQDPTDRNAQRAHHAAAAAPDQGDDGK